MQNESICINKTIINRSVLWLCFIGFAKRLCEDKKSLLGSNATAATKSNVLKNFVNNPPQGFKNIVAVETAVGKVDKAKTQKLIANWQPQSIVEANYKQYYSWYVDGKPNLDELYAFAQQCPLTNGAVVHYARALYNSLAHKNIVFVNNCDGKFSNENLVTEADNKLSVFPNPAKTYTKISCEGLKQIEVYNRLGNLVNLYKSNTNVYTLATSSLAKGLYLIKATTIDNKHYTQKVIVE